jgi:nitroimidazol reductase NimA-like FMN-containing flavoprotein (pyridoxamine 5'-phosphate oxidase superfamily)
MRKMTEEEIWDLVTASNWATICTTTPEGRPYAVEATHFVTGRSLGFMINPRGRTMSNIEARPDVLLKITRAADDLSSWAGVSLFGTARRVTEPDAIAEGWRLLEAVTGADYSKAAAKFSDAGEASPYLLCEITEWTGRCSQLRQPASSTQASQRP